MKVLLINGSSHGKRCTYTALAEVAGALEKHGIETEMFNLGVNPIAGCQGCYACMKKGQCWMDDSVNEFLSKATEVDGFVFGSPVNFASATGRLTSFMDRVFFANMWSEKLAYKPAAAVVTARRSGTTATLDQLNKYFTMSNMPIVSSKYWNMVHGNTPEEIQQDLEGMQTLRFLGNNMAWLLKSIEAGKTAGLPLPEREEPVMTNFIR